MEGLPQRRHDGAGVDSRGIWHLGSRLVGPQNVTVIERLGRLCDVQLSPLNSRFNRAAVLADDTGLREWVYRDGVSVFPDAFQVIINQLMGNQRADGVVHQDDVILLAEFFDGPQGRQLGFLGGPASGDHLDQLADPVLPGQLP